jgi:hypothetical protein
MLVAIQTLATAMLLTVMPAWRLTPRTTSRQACSPARARPGWTRRA